MVWGMLATMRPHQWVKNLFVVAPAVFAKTLTEPDVLVRVVSAFALFCAASSAVYVMNDLVDARADRAHPIKRNRPIASGLVGQGQALAALAALFTIAIAGSILLGHLFAAALIGYVLLNVAYSFRFKRVAYLDVLCIASGFEFRVLGGAFAARVPATGYLLLVTFLLAAYLGFGKRLHELSQGPASFQQRTVLHGYSPKILRALLLVSATLTIAIYIVYTLDPATIEFFGTRYLALSVPFAVFGVGRFFHLVRTRIDSESPTEVMLRDWPFLLNLVLWGVAILTIIYVS